VTVIVVRMRIAATCKYIADDLARLPAGRSDVVCSSLEGILPCRIVRLPCRRIDLDWSLLVQPSQCATLFLVRTEDYRVAHCHIILSSLSLGLPLFSDFVTCLALHWRSLIEYVPSWR
jgi:hypothetical protein